MSLMQLVAYAAQPIRVLSDEEMKRIIDRYEASRFAPRTPDRELEEEPASKRRLKDMCLTHYK